MPVTVRPKSTRRSPRSTNPKLSRLGALTHSPKGRSGHTTPTDQPHFPGALHSQWLALIPFHGVVLAYLERRCADAHLAEDLAQETFLRAAGSATRIEDLDRPTAWLIRIASNLAKDTAEKASRDRLLPVSDACFSELPGPEPIPGDDMSRVHFTVGERRLSSTELGGILRRVWGQLSKRDQLVLGSYYFDGKSAGEAAFPLGSPPTLGKVWLFRARRRLQALLVDCAARCG